MPRVFKVGSYLVYFWISEGMLLEPIHVRIAEKIRMRMPQKSDSQEKWHFACEQCFKNTREEAVYHNKYHRD